MDIENLVANSELSSSPENTRSYDFSLDSVRDWCANHMEEINHYSNRILIDSWVPLAGALALTIPAAIGAVAVKIAEPSVPVFYRKKIHTSDGTEQYQLKTRTMYKDADERYGALVKAGKLTPGKLKSKDDPRITKVGKVLRKTGLDEVWQLGQLVAHVYSREGFFYDPSRHYHYTVAPRPQTEDTVRNAPEEFRENLARGRTGITGRYQVGEGEEGLCAKAYNRDFETRWNIPSNLRVLAKTPLAMLLGHNA